MTEQEQTEALAGLDGWTLSGYCYRKNNIFCAHYEIADYLISYDAIIPLIHKLNAAGGVIDNPPEGFRGCVIDMSPAQLCESLLKATGKWKE